MWKDVNGSKERTCFVVNILWPKEQTCGVVTKGHIFRLFGCFWRNPLPDCCVLIANAGSCGHVIYVVVVNVGSPGKVNQGDVDFLPFTGLYGPRAVLCTEAELFRNDVGYQALRLRDPDSLARRAHSVFWLDHCNTERRKRSFSADQQSRNGSCGIVPRPIPGRPGSPSLSYQQFTLLVHTN